MLATKRINYMYWPIVCVLLLTLVVAVAIVGCNSALGYATKKEFINAIVKELSPEEYSYTFTKLETPNTKEKEYICDFYVWKPTTYYSKWACGGTKGHIDCDLLKLEHYN